MRLRLSAAVLLAVLALTAPTYAAGLSGMGANLFGNYFHFGRPNLPKPAVRAISAGGVRMELQHTQLATIKKAFGGQIRSQGSGSGIANWLCYHTDKGQPSNTWFISNSLGGGDFVMIVAVQATNAGQVPADCDPAPAKFTAPNLGIPGLGASSSDLRAAFGGVSGSKIAYRADVPAADALGTALTAQYIGYILSAGKVVGYGAGETAVANVK